VEFFSFFLFEVLGIEPRALHMLLKLPLCCTSSPTKEVCFVFEMGSHYVDQNGLKLRILLPQPPK
jgi:hypothetical protein